MFSFSSFRGIDGGRSDEDEVPDVKESEENQYESGVGFDDYGNDSFEDVAERVEESDSYTVQKVDHSLKEVSINLEEGADSKAAKLPERGLRQMGTTVDLIHHLLDPCPPDFKNNNRTINCSSVQNDEEEGRIRFEHLDTDGNSDENGDDDSRIGFDDGDTDSRDKVVESEEELNRYTVAQLKDKLAEQGLIQKGKKPDLIQRILNPQPSDFKNKSKVEPWKTSKAKALLIRLLSDKTSWIQGLTPDEAWESSEWFKKYPKDRFISNMKNLKKSIEARGCVVANDNEIIEAELLSIRSSNQNLCPLWHEHDASRLLAQDVKNNIHEGMSPHLFRQTRAEYMEFDLAVFRKHIYQEQRKQREMPMKVAKRNKLAEEAHRGVVEEELARWHADQEHDDVVNVLAGLLLE
jgi:hypothetical protein